MRYFALRRLRVRACHHARFVTSGLLPLSLISPSAFSATDVNTTVLPATTVSTNADSATVGATSTQNAPATVETVTPKLFENWNVVNTEDVLKQMPNLAVRKRFIGDLNSIIAVRGTSNTQSARGLVYADGMLLSNLLGNSYSFPPRWSMVFPAEIRQVDVLYGPFSALYPGNSLGSTVLKTLYWSAAGRPEWVE